MRLNDERALYGLVGDDGRPDPTNARTPAEFVALLGALVEQSGLSLAEIEELAASKGYVLPEQLTATALSNDALPPQQLVVALVRSIGINDREVKYWVEVLWRLESRPAYDPHQTDQEPERTAPRDIDQIYGPKDESGPAEPYVVPAPYDVARVPDVDEAYDAEPQVEPQAEPMSYAAGQVPAADETDEFPQHYEPEPQPGGRGSRTGMHRLRRDDDEIDDDEIDDDGHPGHSLVPLHHDDRDTLVVRPERPRIRHLAARSIRRVDRKAKWPLPVAVGLSVMLVVSVVSWMAFGGDGTERLPDAAGSRPGGPHSQTRTGGGTTGGPGSPTAGEGGQPTGGPDVVPGNTVRPPANPEGPNPPPPTTQGPDPVPTQTRTYGTQLSGTGSTTCTAEGGQWRVRILVNVTVSDPPPGLSPQGQAGLSGSMQGFSLSGSGSSYSGSTTVSVGSSASPNVGTVQWVVTMSVPGGRVARDEGAEGFSCA